MNNTKRQRRTRKNKGGLRTTSNYNDETAITYFINNSTFTILGDDSVSCIPIVATLKNDENIIANSPYKTVRTNYVNKPVSQLLIKIFIWGENPNVIDDTKLRNGTINVTPTDMIRKEVKIQQDIYYKSFYDTSTIMEPLCPCIVYANITKLPHEIKVAVLNTIQNNLVERTESREQPRDKEIIERLLEYDIAFIAMEFMDGYQPLYNFRNDPKYETYKIMALYELDKLHKLRYSHNDFHFNNVMVHPGYKYFTNEPTNENEMLGRVIIIDFGLADNIPEDIDIQNNENRMKLLNSEYGIINVKNIIQIFNNLDYKHMIIQTDYVNALETKLRRNIKDIINSFKIYRTNGGKIFMQRMNDNKINETENQSKIIDEWLKSRPKKNKMREQEPIVLDDDWLNKINENDVKRFEDKLKTNDPQHYAEFIKGIDEINAKPPEYLDNLIKNVLSEPNITENFEFPPKSRRETMKNDK